MGFLRKIRRLIIDSLGFSKTEANGFLILIVLVFLVAILPRVYFSYDHSSSSANESDQTLEEWAAEMKASISRKETNKDPFATQPRGLQKSFDPNIASVKEMMSGGLPEYLAKRVINFREKGGGFDEVDDLKKMYGMNDSLFVKIKDFVIFTEVKKRDYENNDTTRYKADWIKKETVAFSLNTASLEELQSVRGVGPVLSERIVTYRDLLGGFHSVDQLKEVWGLSEEVIEKIIEYADFSGPLKQTTINTDSIKLLARHPYVDYNLARAIINYRQVHGAYQSLDELLKIKVMNDSLYQKLSPYLSL